MPLFQIEGVTLKALKSIYDQTKGVKDVLFFIPFGSVMYGTSIEESDIDIIAICLPKVTDLVLQNPGDRIRNWFDLEGNRLENNNSADNNKIEVQFIDLSVLIRDLVASQFWAIEVLSYLRQNYSLEETFRKEEYRRASLTIDFLFELAEKMTLFDIEAQVRSTAKMSDHVVGKKKTFETLGVLNQWVNEKIEQGFDPKANICSNAILSSQFMSFHGKVFGVGADGSLFNKPVLGRESLELRQFKSHIEAMLRPKYKGDDIKSETRGLANALRFLIQARSVLLKGYIEFPLRDRDIIRDTKRNKKDNNEILSDIQNRYNEILSMMDRIGSYPSKAFFARASAMEFLSDTLLSRYGALYSLPAGMVV